MSHAGLAPLLAALVLAGCGGSGGGEPAPVTPAPVPPPAQEQRAFDKLAEKADESDASAEPPPTDEEAAAIRALERLTAEPPVAFYLTDDRAVLVARAIEVQGTGSEVSALLLHADGKSEPLAEWPAGGDGGATVKAGKVRRLLASRLAGKPMVELVYTPWLAGKAELRLETPAVSVSWKKRGALSARAGGRRTVIGKVEAVKPHVPRPAGVFASGESPVAVVVVRHEPAGGAEGGVGVIVDLLRFDVPGGKGP